MKKIKKQIMLIKGLQILTVLLFVLITIKILGFWIIQCFSRNKKKKPLNDYCPDEKNRHNHFCI